MAHDGKRAMLHQRSLLGRFRERREPGAERAAGLRDDERARKDEKHARTLEPPAGRVVPAGPDHAEHEDREHQRELQRNPAAAACAERRDVSQGG